MSKKRKGSKSQAALQAINTKPKKSSKGASRTEQEPTFISTAEEIGNKAISNYESLRDGLYRIVASLSSPGAVLAYFTTGLSAYLAAANLYTTVIDSDIVPDIFYLDLVVEYATPLYIYALAALCISVSLAQSLRIAFNRETIPTADITGFMSSSIIRSAIAGVCIGGAFPLLARIYPGIDIRHFSYADMCLSLLLLSLYSGSLIALVIVLLRISTIPWKKYSIVPYIIIPSISLSLGIVVLYPLSITPAGIYELVFPHHVQAVLYATDGFTPDSYPYGIGDYALIILTLTSVTALIIAFLNRYDHRFISIDIVGIILSWGTAATVLAIPIMLDYFISNKWIMISLYAVLVMFYVIVRDIRFDIFEAYDKNLKERFTALNGEHGEEFHALLREARFVYTGFAYSLPVVILRWNSSEDTKSLLHNSQYVVRKSSQ